MFFAAVSGACGGSLAARDGIFLKKVIKTLLKKRVAVERLSRLAII